MTPQSIPATEDLVQLREQLRAEIREARETLKDIRREIKDARTLIPLLTDELFQAEVKKQVDKLGAATRTAMDASVEKVIAQFDEVRDMLMGEDKTSRRRGEFSIPELAAAHARLNAAKGRP